MRNVLNTLLKTNLKTSLDLLTKWAVVVFLYNLNYIENNRCISSNYCFSAQYVNVLF
jgi:hypothetical protein